MKKIIIFLILFLNLPVYSKDLNNCNHYINEVNFKTDEKTFLFLALLNIANDKNEFNLNIQDTEKKYYKDLFYKYKSNIESTKDIYIHHKLEEKKFKDSVFILDSRFYNSVDSGFEINLSNANNNEIDRIYYLPTSDIVRDFYTKNNLSYFWKNKVEKENLILIDKYKNKSLQIINDISCFFRVKANYPVDIIFQKSNYFNLLGQSYFSNFENKYIIKIFISDKTKEEDILKTIRHEYVHLIFNEYVKKYSYLIENEINKFYKDIPNLKYFYIEELLAKCIEDIHYYKSKDFIIDMIFYYNKNPLYRHFIDKIPEYISSEKTFIEFLPDLFTSYSANKEINRYINIQNKLFKKV